MTMWNDYEKIARRLDRIAKAFERIANALETANIIEADRKTEPSGYKMKPVEQTEPRDDDYGRHCGECKYFCSKVKDCGIVDFSDDACDEFEQTEPSTDCSWKKGE